MIYYLLKRIFFKMFEGEWLLRCGVLNVYIKLECVCIFYNVYEVKYY